MFSIATMRARRRNRIVERPRGESRSAFNAADNFSLKTSLRVMMSKKKNSNSFQAKILSIIGPTLSDIPVTSKGSLKPSWPDCQRITGMANASPSIQTVCTKRLPTPGKSQIAHQGIGNGRYLDNLTRSLSHADTRGSVSVVSLASLESTVGWRSSSSHRFHLWLMAEALQKPITPQVPNCDGTCWEMDRSPHTSLWSRGCASDS
mmetsp:Transcript_91394/g.279715  ORF Transcript_91394/g.279715 Transcript_91394/m.279715 type:complete len:205 (-) Transcript_91394:207-821(-)